MVLENVIGTLAPGATAWPGTMFEETMSTRVQRSSILGLSKHPESSVTAASGSARRPRRSAVAALRLLPGPDAGIRVRIGLADQHQLAGEAAGASDQAVEVHPGRQVVALVVGAAPGHLVEPGRERPTKEAHLAA